MRVEFIVSGGMVTWLDLQPDDTVSLRVDGKDYVGLRMPSNDEAMAVITWDAEGQAVTTYPEGYDWASESVPVGNKFRVCGQIYAGVVDHPIAHFDYTVTTDSGTEAEARTLFTMMVEGDRLFDSRIDPSVRINHVERMNGN